MNKQHIKILLEISSHFKKGYKVERGIKGENVVLTSPSGYIQVLNNPDDINFISIIVSQYNLKNKIEALEKELGEMRELEEKLDREKEKYDDIF